MTLLFSILSVTKLFPFGFSCGLTIRTLEDVADELDVNIGGSGGAGFAGGFRLFIVGGSGGGKTGGLMLDELTLELAIAWSLVLKFTLLNAFCKFSIFDELCSGNFVYESSEFASSF